LKDKPTFVVSETVRDLTQLPATFHENLLIHFSSNFNEEVLCLSIAERDVCGETLIMNAVLLIKEEDAHGKADDRCCPSTADSTMDKSGTGASGGR
jgi:hypothetical protein